MVLQESDMLSQGEVESSLQTDQQPKNNPYTSLGRQSSIYSLTLDEFQNTLCEGSKNFGSMNMDEFLSSIWTAEENHMINSFPNHNNNTHNINSNNSHFNLTETPNREKSIAKQPSLVRQGSLTLPSPLCRKTVEEVWSEISKGQQEKHLHKKNSDKNVHNQDSATRQPTFGEMTLEDFLVKAGVVRESVVAHAILHHPPPPLAQQPQQYGMYQTNNTGVGPGFVNQPVMGVGGGAAVGLNPYQTMPQGSVAAGESSAFAANGGRNGVYPPQQPPPQPQAVCYGGRMLNGGGGYVPPPQPMAMPAPMSPVSSDGLGTSQVENSASHYGLDMGALRGRKRIVDGPIEKVVERRQRRMIKNRESAARSRARKQAYTVELEAELNQLREENAQLKQALAEIERKRKQQYFEEMRARVHNKAYKAKDRLKMFRRTSSGPF